MKIQVTARNLELTDRLRQEVERKLRRLDRITHPDSEASVELIANASHAADASHVAEVTLQTRGTLVRSVASGSTAMAALNLVIDKLERQVVREKERPRSVRERNADEATAVLAREAVRSLPEGDGWSRGGSAEDRPGVVKVKRHDMAPMFEEDAIARMEELGHAFFIFLNAESDALNVVYRRLDGRYGVIEPVLPRPRSKARQ